MTDNLIEVIDLLRQARRLLEAEHRAAPHGSRERALLAEVIDGMDADARVLCELPGGTS